MKNYFLLLSAALLLDSSRANHQAEQQSEPAGLLRPEAFQKADKYQEALAQLAKLNAASDQSGLTSLTLNSGGTHTWQELDAYYQKADALPYSGDLKRALKEKAVFGLVAVHGLLDKAPLAKRTYYADQFFAQPHIDPKLALAFLKNLQNKWPAEKQAAAKARTHQQLQADMARAIRKVPTNWLLPDTEEVKKALAAVEKEQLAQQQKVRELQQQLAAI